MSSCIYWIRNKADGKYYIGSTKEWRLRLKNHKYLLRNNQHRNNHLQFSWNLHGEESFAFEVLEYVPEEELLNVEQWYLDNTRCLDRRYGYNFCPSAHSAFHSESSRKKISAALTGRPVSEATRRKISASHLGVKLSPSHCLSIGRSKINLTPETRRRMSISAQSRPPASSEARESMRQAQLKRWARVREQEHEKAA